MLLYYKLLDTSEIPRNQQRLEKSGVHRTWAGLWNVFIFHFISWLRRNTQNKLE